MMISRKLAALSLLVTACAAPTPPAPPAPRTAMTVNAPFAKTWGAVIDVLADNNISVKTLDRSSGFVVAERVTVPFKGGKESPYADCGRKMGIPQPPTHADYSVRVKDAGSTSTVQVTATWLEYNPLVSKMPQQGNCSTKGVWESAMESAIKERSEK